MDLVRYHGNTVHTCTLWGSSQALTSACCSGTCPARVVAVCAPVAEALAVEDCYPSAVITSLTSLAAFGGGSQVRAGRIAACKRCSASRVHPIAPTAPCTLLGHVDNSVVSITTDGGRFMLYDNRVRTAVYTVRVDSVR